MSSHSSLIANTVTTTAESSIILNSYKACSFNVSDNISTTSRVDVALTIYCFYEGTGSKPKIIYFLLDSQTSQDISYSFLLQTQAPPFIH